MSKLGQEELNALAKTLFGVSLVLAPIGFALGVFYQFLAPKANSDDLRPFILWSAICIGSFLLSVWVGRTQWGWFRKKDR